MSPDVSYKASLFEDLEDCKQATAYVKAALEDGDAFVLALQDCAKAWEKQVLRENSSED